jgi:hypothetical protein
VYYIKKMVCDSLFVPVIRGRQCVSTYASITYKTRKDYGRREIKLMVKKKKGKAIPVPGHGGP